MAVCLWTAIDVAAQQGRKKSIVGLLVPDVQPTVERGMAITTMLAGLNELGWVEGKNLVLETRTAGLDPQRQRELAAELKALPVALIIRRARSPFEPPAREHPVYQSSWSTQGIH